VYFLNAKVESSNIKQQERDGFFLTFSDEASKKELTLAVDSVDKNLALYDEDRNFLKQLSFSNKESYVTYSFEANKRYFIGLI